MISVDCDQSESTTVDKKALVLFRIHCYYSVENTIMTVYVVFLLYHNAKFLYLRVLIMSQGRCIGMICVVFVVVCITV